MPSEFDALLEATPAPDTATSGGNGSEFDALLQAAPSRDYSVHQPETDAALKETPNTDVALERLKKAIGYQPIDWSKAGFDPQVAKEAWSAVPGKLSNLWNRRTLFKYDQPPAEEQPPATVQATSAAAGKLPSWMPRLATDEEYRQQLSGEPVGATGAPQPGFAMPGSPEYQRRKAEAGGDAKTAWEAANKSLPPEVNPVYWLGVGMEKVADQLPESTYRDAMKIQAGLAQSAGALGAGLASPVNAAVAMAPEGKIAQGLIQLTFAGIAIAGTPAQVKRFNEAKDLTEKTKIAAEMAAMWVPVAIPALKKLAGPAIGNAIDDLVTSIAKRRAKVKEAAAPAAETAPAAEPGAPATEGIKSETAVVQPQEEVTTDATEKGPIAEGGEPEHPGISPGENVSENVEEVRTPDSEQTSDSGGAGGTAPEQEPVTPIISHSKYKHYVRKQKAGYALTEDERQKVLAYEDARRKSATPAEPAAATDEPVIDKEGGAPDTLPAAAPPEHPLSRLTEEERNDPKIRKLIVDDKTLTQEQKSRLLATGTWSDYKDMPADQLPPPEVMAARQSDETLKAKEEPLFPKKEEPAAASPETAKAREEAGIGALPRKAVAASIEMSDGKRFDATFHLQAVSDALDAGYSEADLANARRGFVDKEGNFFTVKNFDKVPVPERTKEESAPVAETTTPTETAPPVITRENPLKMTVGKFYQAEDGTWKKITRGKASSDATVTLPRLIKRLVKKAEERAAGTEKPKRVRESVDDFGSSAESPIATKLVSGGDRLMSKTTAQKKGLYEKNKEQWDDAPALAHPSHNKIYDRHGGGLMPDVAATNMGLDREEMYRGLEKESRSTRNRVEEDLKQRKVEKTALKQIADFEKARKAEEQAGQPGISASELNVGDNITIGGEKFQATDLNPDDMSVTLKDGEKYGTQIVDAHEVLHGEHEPALKTDRKNEIAQKVYSKDYNELDAKQKGVVDTHVANEPDFSKGQPPEKELLPAEEQPFNLVGEEPPSNELTKEGAARKAAEDAAALKKAQPEFDFNVTREDPVIVAGQHYYQDEHGNWWAAYKTMEGKFKPEEDYPVTFPTLLKILNEEAAKRAGEKVPEAVTEAVKLTKEATSYGQMIYRKGVAFKDWAREMVKKFGNKILEHLERIFTRIAGAEEIHRFSMEPREGYSIEPRSGYRYAAPDAVRLNTKEKAASEEFIDTGRRQGQVVGPDFHEVTLPALGKGHGHEEFANDVANAEGLVKRHGETIHWYRGYPGNRGFRAGEKIFVNIDQVHRPGGVFQFVAAHEFAHLLKIKHPEIWQKLADSLLTDKGFPFYKRLEFLGYDERKYQNEHVSDFVAETLANPARFREAMGRDPGLFRNVARKLTDYLDNEYRGTLEKFGLRGDKTATAAVVNLAEGRENVMKALEEARTKESPHVEPPPAGEELSRVPMTKEEQARRAFEQFRKEAERGGNDPNDPAIYEHWKNHLESLPDPGETLQQHHERTPNLQVNKTNYDYALSNNQIGLASRMKRTALARGVNFEPETVKPGIRKKGTPVVESTSPTELRVKVPLGKTSGKGGKVTTQEVSFNVPVDKMAETINYHLDQGHEIVAAPKGALEKAAELKGAKATVPVEPAKPLDEWSPEHEDPVPTVDAGNGTTKPPPPGTVFSPLDMPEGWSDWTKIQSGKLIDKFVEKWQEWWPRTYASMKAHPDTPVIKAHQQWLKDALDYMHRFSQQEWWHELRKMKQTEINTWEEIAVKAYRHFRDEIQMHPEVAWEKAVTFQDNPLENLFRHRKRREEIEEWAAKELGVKRPKRVDDPYIARLTNREGKMIVDLGFGEDKYLTSQLRKSIGVFDKPRVHDTMNDGLRAHEPVQYDPTIAAVWQRERVGTQLVATARMLKTLRDEGALYDKRLDAMAASNDGKTAIKIEGLGGREYYARSRAEAGFIEQNLNKIGGKSAIAKATEMMNVYIRNPSLINPLPHITKNMLFKYVLARIGNATFRADSAEFVKAGKPELLSRFEKVFPTPETSLRHPQMRAREVTSWNRIEDWSDKIQSKMLAVNSWSQKIIFEYADPAMRYALWKSYVRKGMGDLEAANHVWLDLIRYDENSGALNFWKQWPGNWFATWRTGTYVTMFKAFAAHPVRTALFFGALEYMREIIYRKTGLWTHLPIDYAAAPLAELIDSTIKANKDIAAGRDPVKAYGQAALQGGSLVATTALFGPGGGQAPDTISRAMEIIKGDPQGRTQLMSMFWGISQLINMPGEFIQFQKDGDPKHLALLLSSFAFGTHAALSYEPRRLGKWLPESLPGMTYSPDVMRADALRQYRDEKAQRALRTYENRTGVTRAFYQGSKEQQWEQLERATGRRPHHQGPPVPHKVGPPAPP